MMDHVQLSRMRWIPPVLPGETLGAAPATKSRRPMFKSDRADRIGISTDGVAFVRHGTIVLVPWPEIRLSRWYAGPDDAYIATSPGSPNRGGPWKIDRRLFAEIILDPHYPGRIGADYFRKAREREARGDTRRS